MEDEDLNSLDLTDGSKTMPLLPLRDVVVFPHMVIPLFVGRNKSIAALESAMASSNVILLTTQKQAVKDEPSQDDLYLVGTVSKILQLLKLPDGTVKVLVEGIERGSINSFLENTNHFQVSVTWLDLEQTSEIENIDILLRSLVSQFEQYVKLNKKISPEIISSLAGIDDPIRLVDTIASHMSLKIPQKQKVLEILDLKERIDYLMSLMEDEIDFFEVDNRIRNKVKGKMEKNQREYFLNEKMKAIQEELGDINEHGGNEIEILIDKKKT